MLKDRQISGRTAGDKPIVHPLSGMDHKKSQDNTGSEVSITVTL